MSDELLTDDLPSILVSSEGLLLRAALLRFAHYFKANLVPLPV